jgi:hypothetical protein
MWPERKEEAGEMSPKRHRAIRAGRSVPLAAAVIAIGVSTVAGGAVQRRATTTIPAQGMGSAIARCKDGQVALAAGFASPGFNPGASGGPVARFASMPAGKRGVKTTGFNFGTEAGELDSFAYCGKRARPPKVRSKHVQVAPSSYRSVVARCPHGSQAIAGGFGTNQSVVTLTSKRKGKRGWKVGGANITDSGSPARLIAYTYCKAPGPKIVTRSRDATVGSGVQTSRVKCPKHTKALSGGFDGHAARAGNQLTAAGALTSKRAAHGRAWTTSALSVSAPNEATITTYAYCRR